LDTRFGVPIVGVWVAEFPPYIELMWVCARTAALSYSSLQSSLFFRARSSRAGSSRVPCAPVSPVCLLLRLRYPTDVRNLLFEGFLFGSVGEIGVALWEYGVAVGGAKCFLSPLVKHSAKFIPRLLWLSACGSCLREMSLS